MNRQPTRLASVSRAYSKHTLLNKEPIENALSKSTPEKSQALFMNVVRKLGTPTETKQVGWQVNTTTSGTYLRSRCSTKFSNNATAEETIVWKKGSDGTYRLYGYHISSEDLITR